MHNAKVHNTDLYYGIRRPTLRFGRVVAFFAVGMWSPCRDVSYCIRI
jgi:hypothetical protein